MHADRLRRTSEQGQRQEETQPDLIDHVSMRERAHARRRILPQMWHKEAHQRRRHGAWRHPRQLRWQQEACAEGLIARHRTGTIGPGSRGGQAPAHGSGSIRMSVRAQHVKDGRPRGFRPALNACTCLDTVLDAF